MVERTQRRIATGKIPRRRTVGPSIAQLISSLQCDTAGLRPTHRSSQSGKRRAWCPRFRGPAHRLHFVGAARATLTYPRMACTTRVQVDTFEGRDVRAVAAWLKDYPSVRIVSRDRAGTDAAGCVKPPPVPRTWPIAFIFCRTWETPCTIGSRRILLPR